MELSSLQRGSSVRNLRRRLLAAMWLTVIAFFGLLVRLYTLQVLRGDELANRGRRNFVQEVRIAHDRGIIYDRYGRIVADNRPTLDCQVTPAFLGKHAEAKATLTQLAGLIGLSPDELDHAVETVGEQHGLDRFVPIVIKRDLSGDQVEAVESERSLFRLDGVNIVEGRRRYYPYGSAAAHLLGYVKEISAGELDRARQEGNPLGYRPGDLIGRDGVERINETDLRGVDGYEKIVVDAKGRKQHDAYIRQLLGEHRRVPPKPGHNVFVTIDIDLQLRAQEAFDGKAGAVVAVDPRTGQVLALVSIPEYDPNLVSGLLGPEEKERLDGDPLKPWLNRPIQGQYSPGSTFKAITGLAALANNATTPHEYVNCPGYFRLGRHTWRCWKEWGHGPMDLKHALKNSCDVYFYNMGNRIGIDAIAGMARMFGFGSKSGIALRHERPGLVPDEAYHDRVDRASGGYQRGMAVNTSIGQGDLLVTPLQLAMAYAAIANKGTLFVPQIIDRIETADLRVTHRFMPQARSDAAEQDQGDPVEHDVAPGEIGEEVTGDPPVVVRRFEPEPRAKLPIPSEDMEAVRAGLFAVTNEPGGTGYFRRSRNVSMAGKTGTSQVVRIGRERRKSDEMDYWERDHAWFVAYAPAEDPQIVVAVINEHSGHGGSEAEPVAVAVIDAYFDLVQERAASVTASLQPPGAGEQNSRDEERQPGAEAEQPRAKAEQPRAETELPRAKAEQSGAEKQQPATEKQRPATEKQRPATEKQQPATEKQQPGADEQRPGADEQQPGADEQQPGADEQQPRAEKRRRATQEHPRGAGEQQQGVEEQQP